MSRVSVRRLEEVAFAYHSPIHKLAWAGGRPPPPGELVARPPAADGPRYFSCVGGKEVIGADDLAHIEDWRVILEKPVEFATAMDTLLLGAGDGRPAAAPAILLDLSLKADLKHYYTTYCDGGAAGAIVPARPPPEMVPSLRLGGAADADLRFAAAQLLVRGASAEPDGGKLAQFVYDGGQTAIAESRP